MIGEVNLHIGRSGSVPVAEDCHEGFQGGTKVGIVVVRQKLINFANHRRCHGFHLVKILVLEFFDISHSLASLLQTVLRVDDSLSAVLALLGLLFRVRFNTGNAINESLTVVLDLLKLFGELVFQSVRLVPVVSLVLANAIKSLLHVVAFFLNKVDEFLAGHLIQLGFVLFQTLVYSTHTPNLHNVRTLLIR